MTAHLSDHDLVLALDRELPARRQAAAEAHLRDCQSCRARRAVLERASSFEPTGCRADAFDTARVDAAREALRRRLAAARHQPATITERLASAAVGVPRSAAIGAAVAAVLIGGALAWRFGAVSPGSQSRALDRDSLPIASLTPGATRNISADELCASGRHEPQEVSTAVRDDVLRAYRMERVPVDEYELDYLITPELGGAPTAQNLWPQRYSQRRWNASIKDQLERLLPMLVCDGTISLQTAQRDIAVDWIAAYQKYFRTDLPLQAHAELRTAGRDDEAVFYPAGASGAAPALRLISFSPVR